MNEPKVVPRRLRCASCKVVLWIQPESHGNYCCSCGSVTRRDGSLLVTRFEIEHMDMYLNLEDPE